MLGQLMIPPFPQRAGTVKRRILLLAATVFGAAFSATGPALADFGDAAVSHVSPSEIIVRSNGEKYTVAEPGIFLQAKVEYVFNTESTGKVKSFGLWLRTRSEHSDWVQYKQHKFAKFFPLGKRDNLVIGEQWLKLPHPSYTNVMTYYCNEQAEALRHIGKTNEEIFSQDRPLEVAVDMGLEYEMTGTAGGQQNWNGFGFGGADWPTATKFTVICEKSAPPPPVPPAITGVAVVVQGIDPANSQGQCQMRLNGAIVSNLPNVDATFRYVDDKGNQSDLKTVKTGDDRRVSFEHTYPLSPGEKNAKVRIVGENLNFSSSWKDFDYDCKKSADSFATLLPPKAMVLEVGATANDILYQGYVCPAEIKMIGAFKGRGSTSGTAVLAVNGAMKVQKPFELVDEETKYIDGEYALSWDDIEGPLKQDVDVALYITNANGEQVDSLTKTHTVSCTKSEAVKQDAFASANPEAPALTLLTAYGDKKLIAGHICPERVVLTAKVLGQDQFEGRAILVAKQDQSFAEPQSQVQEFNFAVADEEALEQTFAPLVKWSNVPQSGEAPLKQTMDFSFRVVRHGITVASVERSLEVKCKGVEVADVTINFDPPQVHNLEIVPTTEEILYQGHICPAKVKLNGSFTGQGPASGRAVLIAGTRVKAMEEFNIEEGVTEVIRGEHTFNWEGVQDSLEQQVNFTLRLDNAEGAEVDSLTKQQTFECRKPVVVGQGAAGSLATGNPGPGSSQQAAQPATIDQLALQSVPSFAIQSPKGRVRQGQIQLSGGKPNARYALRFYRKTESGYQQVRSAKLPRQMTGTTASFKLRALSGSRVWRLEVCPAGSKDKKACKTSDFSLPMVEGAGKVKTPQKPASTKVFIMPGVGN